MNWVAENHYAMIVHQERLDRAQRPGMGSGLLHYARERLSSLRDTLAVGQQRRTAGTAQPSVVNARPLEAQ
jgi:hypothetical protein